MNATKKSTTKKTKTQQRTTNKYLHQNVFLRQKVIPKLIL